MGRKRKWGVQEVTETVAVATTSAFSWIDKLRQEMKEWRDRMTKKFPVDDPRYHNVKWIHQVLEHEYDNLRMLSFDHLSRRLKEKEITFSENRKAAPSRRQQVLYAVTRLQNVLLMIKKDRQEKPVNFEGLDRATEWILNELPKSIRALDSIDFPRRFEGI